VKSMMLSEGEKHGGLRCRRRPFAQKDMLQLYVEGLSYNKRTNEGNSSATHSFAEESRPRQAALRPSSETSTAALRVAMAATTHRQRMLSCTRPGPRGPSLSNPESPAYGPPAARQRSGSRQGALTPRRSSTASAVEFCTGRPARELMRGAWRLVPAGRCPCHVREMTSLCFLL